MIWRSVKSAVLVVSIAAGVILVFGILSVELSHWLDRPRSFTVSAASGAIRDDAAVVELGRSALRLYGVNAVEYKVAGAEKSGAARIDRSAFDPDFASVTFRTSKPGRNSVLYVDMEQAGGSVTCEVIHPR